MKKLSSSRILLFAALAVTFLTCGAAGADPAMPHAFQKTDYSMTKPIEVPRPNVLLLLDVGSQMVFTPRGILPMADDGLLQYPRMMMYRESTYGSGARPLNESLRVDYGRWGRDLDNSNNIIGDPDCYYSSDPNNPYFLTFKNGKLPSGVKNGDRVSGYPKYTYSPYPKQSFSPNQAAYDQLVPNDSRMYMMKLVLWRLTHPEDPDLLANINLAMATNYQEDTPQGIGGTLMADYYKYAPYGYNPNAPRGTPGSEFIYGTAPSWSIGIGSDGTLNGQNYVNSATSITGVIRDFYNYAPNTADWRHVHRAWLRVPFDRFYEEDKNQPGKFTPTKIRDNFAKLIDGVETINDRTYEITNPELFADGQSPIATSLYARDYIGGKTDSSKMSNYDNTATAVRYAPSNKRWSRWGLTFQMNLETSTNSEGLTGGQALAPSCPRSASC